MPKTWAQKRASAKAAHVVMLDKPFAGAPAGTSLLIPDPDGIERHVAQVALGQTLDVVELRARLARESGARAACPVVSSIHLRTVAELALERIAQGAKPADVTPFWRMVEPESPLAAKLSCGPDFIRTQRAIEAGR